MEQTPAKKKKKRDPFRRVKYVGYCLAQLPSGSIQMADFIRYAKFQLALKTGRLLKDPVWDAYTQEEILVEFFAHQFSTNKKFVQDFEVDMLGHTGESDDFAVWADRKMAEEAKIREKTLSGMEDRVEFNPADVMGDD